MMSIKEKIVLIVIALILIIPIIINEIKEYNLRELKKETLEISKILKNNYNEITEVGINKEIKGHKMSPSGLLAGAHLCGHEKVMDLSGGQRQRAFIAMSLAQNTKVLLLDEPTTYLDIYHQIEILEVVKKLNEEHNITIVMVLHDINQAIKYSHNIVIMKDGTIINEGSPEEVINKNIIEDVYKVQGFIGKSEEENEMYFIPLSVC